MKRKGRKRGCERKLLALAVAACFSAGLVHANPTAPTVVRGQATFANQGNKLTVTNTPGAVINWQSFSIPSQNITQFIQQSATSAVLNRVTGTTPSSILGQLQSNGRVYLINPNGITIGQGAMIDVAGFVASSLNITDADFVAGRNRFAETPGAGNVVNQGSIKTTAGGMVYLVGQNVENHGIIKSPQGEIILAAGKSIELVDAGTPEVRVQITAPDNQSLNLGQLLAEGGRIGMYSGLVRQGGTANANTAVRGENGKIVFKAVKDVKLDAGSVTTASGPTAGSIKIEAQTGTVTVAGTVEANATAGRGGSIEVSGLQGVTVESTGRIAANGMDGGTVTLASAAGPVRMAGQSSADATAGRGGQVAITAATQASLAAGGRVTASGTQGGGSVSVTGNENVSIESGSLIQANGAAGGAVTVQAPQGSVEIDGGIEAAGNAAAGGIIRIAALTDVTLGDSSVLSALGAGGGEVRVEAWDGTTLASGWIGAFGNDGPGGKVLLLGPRVGLVRNVFVNVSGRTGGGVALVGGDFHGDNPEIPNSQRVYVGPDARIAADAIETGDGGKVIVWSDEVTRFHGNITARGGANGGDGGFVEVSGKEILNFDGKVNVAATAGSAGTILLDPRDITIQDTAGANDGEVIPSTDESILFAEGTATANFTISDETLEALQGSIVLQATRDITIGSGLSGGGLVLTNQTSGERVVLQAGRHVIINSPLTTYGAAIWLEADSPHSNGYPATAVASGADGAGAVRINAAVQSFAPAADPVVNGGKITLIAGNNTKGGTNGGGFELNADVNAGAGGIDVALSTQATGQLSFYIGSAGQAQFTTSDTGQLKSTGQLTIGQATTAGTDGLGTDAITIKVDQLAIGTSAGGPVTLAADAGSSLVLTSGDGGILVDRPLSTDQPTSITTTGALTINASLTTNGETLSITADSISGANYITGTGTITCTGTGCPGGTVITWDGGAGDLNWLTAANWSGDVVPTSADAVQISSSFSGSTISISGTAAAKSLIADAPVSISGLGSLSLTEASQFTRTLTLTGATANLSGVGPVAVNGSSGVLTWNGGTMASGGSFTLGVGSAGTLGGTLTLNRVFQNSGTLTLSGVNLGGTGSFTNAATMIAATSTSNTIGVALSNPSNSLIQVLGTLTAASFPNNDGQISVGSGGTFGTGGAALANSSSSSVVISGGNYSTTSGNTVTTDGGGNLVVSGAISAGTVTLLASGSGGVTLNAGSTVSASGNGDSIVIAGARFNAGSGTLNPGAGRFLVWSSNSNPFSGGTPDDRGSLAYDFKQYNAAYGSATVLGSGNGFLYTLAPTITPTLQGTVTKTYDGLTAATLAAGNFKTTGIGEVDGDTIVLSNPSTGIYSSAHAGNPILVTASSASSLASATNGAATVYGYQVSSNPASGTVGTINAAQLTASASIGGTTTKTYDGLTAASGATVSGGVTGLVGTDTMALNTSGVSLNYDSAHVASATTISATGSVALGALTSTGSGAQDGSSAANRVVSLASDYVLAGQPTITSVGGSINAASLTVTANSTSKTYGQTVTFSGTEFSSSGLVNGETIGTVALFSSGAAAGANVAGSPYAITPSAAAGGTFAASDYAITYINGALTVTPAVINLALSRTYDGSTNFGAGVIGTLSGVNGETLAGGSGTGAVGSPNVAAGTQSLSLGSLSLGNGTGLASNYTLVGGTHTATITPANLTGAIANQGKTYGADDPALAGITVTLGGVIGSDAGNVGTTLSSLTRTAGENVGSYGITSGTFNALSGPAAGNYNTPTWTGSPTLAISPASLTGIISNQVKTYGTSDPALASIGVTLGGLVNRTVSTWNGSVLLNDTGNVNTTLASLTRNAGENVGSYSITSGTLNALTGSAAGNYSGASLSTVGDTLTINPAILVASITDQTKTYAANDPAVSTIPVTLGGAVNTIVTDWNGNVTAINDTGALAATLADLTRVPGENVGVYNVTGGTIGALTGSAAANYGGASFVTSGTTLVIEPPPPGAVVSPTVATWDGTAPVDITFTWTANASGAWETGSNWSKGFAPPNGAVVMIPDIGAAGVTHNITYSGGTTNVRNVTSAEALTLAGGTLNLGMNSSDVSTIPLITLTGGVLGGPGTVNVAALNLLAGVLNGTGTIVGNVNNTGGTVAPGNSPGSLTISGNYVQGPRGTLAIELGGTAAGTQYDQLIVTGSATLGGTLGVALIGGFVPPSGSTFTIVQAGAVSGAFASAPTALGTIAVTTSYLPSSVNVATSAAVPDQITNTQNQSTQTAPPDPIVTTISTLPPTASGGAGVPVVYLVMPTGELPLSPTTTIPAGSYVNVNTGQSILLGTNSLPEPGTYFNSVTLEVIVVIIDPATGLPVIYSGSLAGSAESSIMASQVATRRGGVGVCK